MSPKFFSKLEKKFGHFVDFFGRANLHFLNSARLEHTQLALNWFERVAHRLKALYFSEALRKLKRSKVVLATFEDYKYRDRLYFPELGFSIKKRFEWPEKEGLFRVKISNGKDLSLNVDFDE